MEDAEENLAELLPLRPLSAAEGSEMLPPLLDVLSFLHQAGYAHGRIKPANIMAVDNQLKISADSLIKIGDRGNALAPSAYDAPEVATAGPSPAADIWSLALTLVAVMTQSEPQLNRSERPAVPDTIPQPLREIVRQCLQVNPRQRCSVGDILRHLQPEPIQTPDLVPARAAQADVPERRSKRWILAPIIIAALLLVAWVVNRFISQRPQVPAAQPSAPASQVADMPVSQSPAPFSDQAKPAQRETVRGGVLQQVLPDVSRSAQSTITGTLKVSVQVSIDDSGNVSQAKFVSAGPSKYFANLGLATARRWKFNPPQVDGRATTSEWILRFQFKRTSTQVFPAQVRP
jgi:TonB family protein